MINLFETDILEEVSIDTKTENEKKIVMFNDDVNSFQFVIYCLIKYCGHTKTQAEQCALMVHNKGKYAVKHGDLLKLTPIKEALCENGLFAEIE
jgi:ATP-dependent Clp protease adaptor protein ClpS